MGVVRFFGYDIIIVEITIMERVIGMEWNGMNIKYGYLDKQLLDYYNTLDICRSEYNFIVMNDLNGKGGIL